MLYFVLIQELLDETSPVKHNYPVKKHDKIYADISEEKVYIQTNTLTLQLKKFQYSVKQKHEYNLLYLPAHEDL